MLEEEQATQERTFSLEEQKMQAEVEEFQKNLRARDYMKIQDSLDVILQSIEPLNFWLPYKDLAKLLIARCTPEELTSFSGAEVVYLIEVEFYKKQL